MFLLYIGFVLAVSVACILALMIFVISEPENEPEKKKQIIDRRKSKRTGPERRKRFRPPVR